MESFSQFVEQQVFNVKKDFKICQKVVQREYHVWYWFLDSLQLYLMNSGKPSVYFWNSIVLVRLFFY